MHLTVSKTFNLPHQHRHICVLSSAYLQHINGYVSQHFLSGYHSDGRSSDQIAMEIAADMTRNLPTLVDIYDEEICAVLKLLKPLSLADIAKIGMSTDMAFAKTKFKTPTQNKKEKGW